MSRINCFKSMLLSLNQNMLWELKRKVTMSTQNMCKNGWKNYHKFALKFLVYLDLCDVTM